MTQFISNSLNRTFDIDLSRLDLNRLIGHVPEHWRMMLSSRFSSDRLQLDGIFHDLLAVCDSAVWRSKIYHHSFSRPPIAENETILLQSVVIR